MSDVKWIKITTDMFDDEKIKLIESMPDKDSILIIWIKLLVQAGKCNATGYIYLNETLPYTDEMLATIFNRPLNTVRLALKVFREFGMIEICQNGHLHISNWEKHQNIKGLEKIREQTRERVARHRQKQKQLLDDVTEKVTLRNATDKNRIDKNRIDKIRKEKNTMSPDGDRSLYSADFEKFWKAYPKKAGKASAYRYWKKARDLPDIEKILEAVSARKSAEQYARDNSLFYPEWPDPERWIKNERWNDDPASLTGGKRNGAGGKSTSGGDDPEIESVRTFLRSRKSAQGTAPTGSTKKNAGSDHEGTYDDG